MENILGIIVTYNPSLDLFKENLNQICKQCTLCIIVDNKSDVQDEIEILVARISNARIIKNPKNYGLGKSYNLALHDYLGSFEFFVTFDQDSYLPNHALSCLLERLKQNSKIGVIGPMFSYEKTKAVEDGICMQKKSIIQSCALFRAKMFFQIGDFNEDYFIDSVDFEYCLRILSAGYQVTIYTGVVIKHELGKQKERFGIKYFSHNTLRNYYMARNHIRISKEYFKKFPTFILKKNVFFGLHLLKLIFLEHDFTKIKYFFKGIKDGL